jgi:hypothetical protein
MITLLDTTTAGAVDGGSVPRNIRVEEVVIPGVCSGDGLHVMERHS